MITKHAAYTTIDGISVVGDVTVEGFRYNGDAGCRIPAGLYGPEQTGPVFLSLDLDHFGEDVTAFTEALIAAGFEMEKV